MSMFPRFYSSPSFIYVLNLQILLGTFKDGSEGVEMRSTLAAGLEGKRLIERLLGIEKRTQHVAPN